MKPILLALLLPLASLAAETPSLFHAAAKGDLAEVKRHLAAGVDIHAARGGSGTALHLAATAETAQALLDAGADPSSLTPIGWTPLHAAAVRGRDGVVTRLLAVKELAVDPKAKDQRTPLHLACERGQTEVVAMLLKAGASTKAEGDTGWTPLHFAAAKGHVAVMKLLLEGGADVDAQSHGGGTPLIEAAVGQPAEVIRILLDAGADPAIKEKKGKTAFDFAREFGNTDVLKQLQPNPETGPK